MAKRGRKRKNAARTKSGRISRAKPFRMDTVYDKGTERAQAMQALYGTDNSDALGRAYRAGFLGTGNDAKKLLDTGRRVAKAYWRTYEVGPIRCPFADRTGGGTPMDSKREKEIENQLNDDLATVARMGVRRQFEMLVIDANPDSGPEWLDRLLYADRRGKPLDIADLRTLRAAVDGLEMLANG